MLVLVPRFEPTHVLELIERHKVTIFAGVPTMYIGLLHADSGSDISSLRVAASGGSPLPTEVFHAFEAKFNAPILQTVLILFCFRFLALFIVGVMVMSCSVRLCYRCCDFWFVNNFAILFLPSPCFSYCCKIGVFLFRLCYRCCCYCCLLFFFVLPFLSGDIKASL